MDDPHLLTTSRITTSFLAPLVLVMLRVVSGFLYRVFVFHDLTPAPIWVNPAFPKVSPV